MKKIIFSLFALLTMVFAGSAYAESTPASNNANKISLYEQPDAKSKVIDTIAPGTPLIPIFTQGQWLKVGEPTTGQVGWINNAELPTQNQVYVKTVTKTPNTPGSNGYQVIQYTGSEQVDEKQMQQLMQNLQHRQVELQQVFDQILNQSIANFNVLLRQLNQQTSQPWVIPTARTIIITPETKSSSSSTATTTPATPSVGTTTPASTLETGSKGSTAQ